MNTHIIILIAYISVLFISIFGLGWASNSLITALNSSNLENPAYSGLLSAKELPSPFDHIKKEQIHVYDDRIVLDIKNANWAMFSDTNSMDPLFDAEANSFEITPDSTKDIHIGDIISYRSEYSTGLTVHRIVAIGNDEEGWYGIAKGDNLTKEDPGKIRFDQINGVMVGIIY